MADFTELAKNKWFILLASAFLVFMLFIVIRQVRQQQSVQQQITDLDRQATTMSQKNKDLTSMIAYLKTDDYTQKAAREQLNLKKDGEFVYSFQQAANPVEAQATETNPADASGISNTAKWWNYFFNNKY